jgi:hypothetical protein
MVSSQYIGTRASGLLVGSAKQIAIVVQRILKKYACI